MASSRKEQAAHYLAHSHINMISKGGVEMKNSRTGFFSSAGAIGFGAFMAAMAMAAAPAAAQTDYPAREIQLMIPFAPGGGVDLFGRTVARVLNDEKIVTRRIQVINKPGAGGAAGMAEMVNRKGDNYMLLGIATHVHATPLTMGTKHSWKDMTPIAKIFSEYQMMVVRTESPIKSLKDVEAALRKDVGSLKIGGASVGNADHMSAAKFARAVGGDPAKLTYVAYSGGESNAAILGGHVDVGMGGLDLIDLVEAGKMRVLAVSAPTRLSGRFKSVPTFVEQGYEVINANWRGIFGPPGMPAPVVQYWRDGLKKMVQTKAWKAELEKNQWADSFESDTFSASLEKDHEVYRALLQQVGLLKK
jgi:putative tricarboxylic transport membrane protein